MKLSMPLMYAGNPREAADRVSKLESSGLDTVWIAEAYGFDAPTLMGYLAAKTETIEIGSAILNVYSRTPGALLQTAAGLDNVSGGRAILGLGASGPRVIEGFHGVPYSKPLGRTAEVIDIVRRGLKRERLENDGIFKLPLTKADGAVTGLGKSLKILTHPERDTIPIYIAALGLKSVEQTAEIADGWIPMLFHPEKSHFGLGRRPRCRYGEALGRPRTAGDQRRRHGRDRRGRGDEGAARPRPAALRALRRWHGRQGQELLQRHRLPVRLREGGRADPGALPLRQEEGGRGARPARVARGRQPRRSRVLRASGSRPSRRRA
ncbi:LLM class flavin-dependent oxidoreductase [Nocardioides sp. B-3]|nr:LLM class flavin-dependent oxidoreductase [Nocardioides sp. B-3]UUZ57961.1 LLM class flavin-dependent oxidoreductase [Nocardioides sp. B-3]